MSGHTPGPWVVTGTKTVRSYSDHANVDFDLIAKCHWLNGEANARLIAAAPDLLALAKQYASECGECSGTGLRTIYNYDGHGSDADDQPCPECAEIRAALAKATP